jgi:hypothetical protein
MRILLKNTASGLYLGRGGKWTNQPETALAFLDEVRAKDHSIYHRLANTQVVVLAEPGAAEASPTACITDGENMAIKTKTNRIQQQTKPEEDRLRSIEGKLLAHQISEASQKHIATMLQPTKLQTGEKTADPGPRTMVQASIDVGFGNEIFIRGEGCGLSWEKGQLLTCIDQTQWEWSGKPTQGKVVFKLLLNDEIWAKGENVEIEPGKTVKIVPSF